MNDLFGKGLMRALKQIYDPPIRGLDSKKKRRRNKAQKLYDQKPIVAAIRSQAIHGIIFSKLSLSAEDRAIWEPVPFPWLDETTVQERKPDED